MSDNEREQLLLFYRSKQTENINNLYNQRVTFNQSSINLSLFFATLCVIDLFGVFPIIALPEAIISCGLYGIPLVIFVITLQIYTAVVLGRCWTIAEFIDPTIIYKNRYPYAAIAEFTYGKYMRLFVTILLDLTVFGGGIPNILVASQNLQLLGIRITDGKFDFSFCYWLLIIGLILCPLMWLGSPKNMKALASVSVVIVSSVAGLTWYGIITSDGNINTSNSTILSPSITILNNTEIQSFRGITHNLPPFSKLLKAYGLIAFQFDVHPMLLTIQMDMHNKRKIGKAVCFGIFATSAMFLTTTVLAAYKYGNTITPNVLELLARGWPLYVTIFLVTLQLCLSNAVGSSALFQHIEEIFDAERVFTIKRCIIRTSIVALAVTIAEFLPRFDLVMGLIGGTLTGPLIFILPPLFYTKMLKLKREYLIEKYNVNHTENNARDLFYKNNISLYYTDDEYFASESTCRDETNKIKYFWNVMHSDYVISIIVIIFGATATITSTYYNIIDITNFMQLWSPCIFNLTHFEF